MLRCGHEGIKRGVSLGVHRVEPGGDGVLALARHLSCEGSRVQLAARDPQPPGELVSGCEQRIGNRDCGLHAPSITRSYSGAGSAGTLSTDASNQRLCSIPDSSGKCDQRSAWDAAMSRDRPERKAVRRVRRCRGGRRLGGAASAWTLRARHRGRRATSGSIGGPSASRRGRGAAGGRRSPAGGLVRTRVTPAGPARHNAGPRRTDRRSAPARRAAAQRRRGSDGPVRSHRPARRATSRSTSGSPRHSAMARSRQATSSVAVVEPAGLLRCRRRWSLARDGCRSRRAAAHRARWCRRCT